MKGLKYIALVLGLLVCVSTSAAKKAKKSKKQAEVAKVDTIPMADFSYAYGIAQTNGLMNYLVQRLGVDTAYVSYFLSGFDDPSIDEQTKQMKAYTAGKDIRQEKVFVFFSLHSSKELFLFIFGYVYCLRT